MNTKTFAIACCLLLVSSALSLATPYWVSLKVSGSGKAQPDEIIVLTKAGKFSLNTTQSSDSLLKGIVSVPIGTQITGELIPLAADQIRCNIYLIQREFITSAAEGDALRFATDDYLINTIAVLGEPKTIVLKNRKLTLTVSETELRPQENQ